MSNLQPELFNPHASWPLLINSSENAETLVSIMALNTIRGVGQKTIQAIYDLGIINSLWNQKQIQLERLLADVGRKNLDLPSIIAEQKTNLLENGKQRAEKLVKKGIHFIANRFEYFPERLKNIANPPRWLFVMGNTNVLASSGIVGIIGTRDASPEGKSIAYHLAKELIFRNVVVLSGLAEGIDKQAHQGAVDYYGQTIGILGHGFDATYASKDQHLWASITIRDGAIITEYLPEESPSRDNFLRRNELLAALSNLVIPVESPNLASGTGATIRRALVLKKPLSGVHLDNREIPTLIKTVENLRSLQIPIFSLPSESEKFWCFVQSTMPNHVLNTSPGERQKRFVNTIFGGPLIINDFTEELRRSSFTEDDIEWLSGQIKQRLGEND